MEISEAVLTYPRVPKPISDDVRSVGFTKLLTTPTVRPATVEIKDGVETYPAVPRPATVLLKLKVDIALRLNKPAPFPEMAVVLTTPMVATP